MEIATKNGKSQLVWRNKIFGKTQVQTRLSQVRNRYVDRFIITLLSERAAASAQVSSEVKKNAVKSMIFGAFARSVEEKGTPEEREEQDVTRLQKTIKENQEFFSHFKHEYSTLTVEYDKDVTEDDGRFEKDLFRRGNRQAAEPGR